MLRPLLAALLPAFASAQAVLQVGPGGFAQIRDAAAAAQPGDVIEVATGYYQPFVLDKAVTIRARPGANVAVLPNLSDPMRIRPPIGTVAKFGRIEFRNPWPLLFAVETRVERGTAWFEDCVFEAPPMNEVAALNVYGATVVLRSCLLIGNGWVTSTAGTQNAGLRADNAQVFATDCRLYGSHSQFDSLGYGGEGVRASNSLVQLVGCDLEGGHQLSCFANAAGPGLRTTGGTVWLADDTVEGGSEVCGLGAPGVVAVGAPPVQLARTTLLGGIGQNGRGPASSGAIAPASLLGTVGAATPLIRGAMWSVDYRGAANWPIGVFLAPDLGAHAEPLVAQPVLLAAPGLVPLQLLMADPQGAASYQTTIPAIAPLLGATFFVAAVGGFALPLQASPPVGGLVW